jgi:hypothetical protein
VAAGRQQRSGGGDGALWERCSNLESIIGGWCWVWWRTSGTAPFIRAGGGGEKSAGGRGGDGGNGALSCNRYRTEGVVRPT